MGLTYITKNTALRTDRKGYAVELFVVHETVGKYPGDLNWLIGSGKVSVNWYINRAGALFCLDDTFRATAHAGVCTSGSHTDPHEEKDGWGWANLASEGVELEGPCDGTPFTAAQLATLITLTRNRMLVYKLKPAQVVQHKDIAWPRGRKIDAMGINWAWFQAQLAPVVVPAPASATIGGGDRDYKCDPAFRKFYDEHGGLLTFGFPTTDQTAMADSSGETCQIMKFENAWLKLKPSETAAWQLRPASLAEIMALTARS